MKPVFDIYTSVPGTVLFTAALVLVMLQLAAMLQTLLTVQSRNRRLLAALHFIIGLAVFGLMMYAGNEYDNLGDSTAFPPHTLRNAVFSVPWLVYAALEILSALLMIVQIRHFRDYIRTYLTPDAVKDTLDWLPVGVCIGDASGTVLLSNLRINELSRCITQQYLFNSSEFWEAVTQKGVPQEQGYLLDTGQGKAYLLTKSPLILRVDGTELHTEQIIASDMTEAYRITQELTAKNQHLKDVQYRMKAVAAYERSLIAAREAMKARTAVHNQMGGVLLSGKYYLDHPDGMDERELLHLLECNNFFLLNEAEQPENKSDLLQDVLNMAKRIGVTVEIEGHIPEQTAARDLLAQAIEQCAANTVRHAGGDRLTVTISETETQFKAEFRNNGKAPEQPVTATGGLLYLRKAAESAGGTVTVQSEPVFVLTLSVPKS